MEFQSFRRSQGPFLCWADAEGGAGLETCLTRPTIDNALAHSYAVRLFPFYKCQLNGGLTMSRLTTCLMLIVLRTYVSTAFAAAKTGGCGQWLDNLDWQRGEGVQS